MANPTDHYICFQRKRDLANQCAGSLEAEGIVVRFYASLHLVEGHMRTKTNPIFWSETHGERKKAMWKSPELKVIMGSYQDLLDLSKAVRYDPCFVARQQDFDNAKGWSSKIESLLEPKLKSRL